MLIENSKIIQTYDKYDIRQESWRIDENDCRPILMVQAYNKNGKHIGDRDLADYICNFLGISPEPISEERTTCRIGFSRKEQKWYGWSCRAIYGFDVGFEVRPGSFINNESLPVGFVAKDLDDCKKLAIAFAEFFY